MTAPDIVIRKFQPKDKDQVRKISHDTAFIGESAAIFFKGEKIISDSLTLYFTDYEPESCFIAEANGEIAGYLIGAKSQVASEKIINSKIAPHLFWEALKSGVFFNKKNMTFILNSLSGMMKGEFNLPDFNKEYPAILHINIKKEFRGLDIGSRLIRAYLDYLREEKINGVHLATMSGGAGEFFSKQGFNLLHEGKRSYFKHILHKDIPVYIYGKKL